MEYYMNLHDAPFSKIKDKSKSEVLSKELFKNPTSEYRGAPFWAWNCKLDKDDLLWQIDNFKDNFRLIFVKCM